MAGNHFGANSFYYYLSVVSFVDVVIVGAGPSGLRVAGLLHQAGLSVAILEASDRVGGRLLTVEPGLDLGATWFWQNESEVLEVISEHGLETFPQHSLGNAMYQVPGNVVQLEGNPLNHNGWRIVGGMAQIAYVLTKDFPITSLSLATKVTAIDIEDEITVVTDKGNWNCRYVVIALPPATAMSGITFNPRLPEDVEKTASLTPVWMGAIRKVVAVYNTPFWRNNGLAGSAISHSGPLREIHDMSDTTGSFGALFGFASAPISELEAIAQLVDIFGPQAQEPVSILIHDWSESEFTSPANVGELTDYGLFGSTLLTQTHCDGRLLFTSTETSTQAAGHIQGALSAAKRTATLIISSIS
jgi:monoamine oxidase